MYKVSLFENNVIKDVFDVRRHVDKSVEVFDITEEEKNMIDASGKHGDFKYIDGRIVYEPQEIFEQ